MEQFCVPAWRLTILLVATSWRFVETANVASMLLRHEAKSHATTANEDAYQSSRDGSMVEHKNAATGAHPDDDYEPGPYPPKLSGDVGAEATNEFREANDNMQSSVYRTNRRVRTREIRQRTAELKANQFAQLQRERRQLRRYDASVQANLARGTQTSHDMNEYRDSLDNKASIDFLDGLVLRENMYQGVTKKKGRKKGFINKDQVWLDQSASNMAEVREEADIARERQTRENLDDIEATKANAKKAEIDERNNEMVYNQRKEIEQIEAGNAARDDEDRKSRGKYTVWTSNEGG